MTPTWVQTNQKNISHNLWPTLPYFSVTLREYHIHAGKTELAASLKKQFPGEEEAIDELMRLMKVEGGGGVVDGMKYENGKKAWNKADLINEKGCKINHLINFPLCKMNICSSPTRFFSVFSWYH